MLLDLGGYCGKLKTCFCFIYCTLLEHFEPIKTSLEENFKNAVTDFLSSSQMYAGADEHRTLNCLKEQD